MQSSADMNGYGKVRNLIRNYLVFSQDFGAIFRKCKKE